MGRVVELNTGASTAAFSIRRAKPKDAPGAVEVLRRSITELCVEDHRGDVETLEKWLANKTSNDFLSWLASADNFCVLAEMHGRIVGIGLLHRRGEVRLCYLSPGAQHQGIGKALILALEQQAKLWGLDRLSLQSTIEARAFYERLGFHPGGAAVSGFGVSRCHPYEKRLA